ncbi:MAG: class I SAM-dependent methyltransferase [Candidatus Hydrogenedentes bacterium]|jgi:ubiquinone/menaquinone biosynthesis C-methylase UbiE|nr:class I SAM-dependent methyltransferase [Candidatus Hydrogenedentota bacterium]
MAQSSPLSPRPVSEFFDDLAPKWDSMISAGHSERLRRLLAPILPADPARILDVGCGTGVLIPILTQELPAAGTVIAIDISALMIQETQKRIASLQPAAPCYALQTDVMAAPFSDCSFDSVFCNSCFPHFEDQQRAMLEMARLLRPGGMLVICHSESRDAINKLHREMGGVVGGHELPDDAGFQALVSGASLDWEHLEDHHDGFLLIARR